MSRQQHSTAKPSQYRGKLDVSGVTAGMNVAIRNARRLLEDAELLQAQGRSPSAAALAILSIEESGKLQILRRMSIAPGQDELNAGWKDYRRHTSKNPHWIVGELIANGARQLRNFRSAVESGEHADILDALKQLAFYSDCYGDRAYWSEPKDAINSDLASYIIEQARVVLPVREVNEREIVLWVEHVGPHYAKPRMGAAVVDWYAALKSEGLSDIDPDSVSRFIGDLAEGT